MDAGHTRLHLEELDERLNPSPIFRTYGVSTGPVTLDATPIAYTTPVYHGYRIYATNPLLVDGGASGNYTKTLATGSSSATYQLNGTVNLLGFGKLNLSGVINAEGSQQGTASGQLTLSTNAGAITIRLTDPSPGPNGVIPSQMIFTVTSATGAFSHAGGSGLIHFSASASTSTSGSFILSMT